MVVFDLSAGPYDRVNGWLEFIRARIEQGDYQVRIQRMHLASTIPLVHPLAHPLSVIPKQLGITNTSTSTTTP